LSPDGSITPSPVDNYTSTSRRKSQVTFKNRPVRIKSPSGKEYEVEWTSDDVRKQNKNYSIFTSTHN